VPPDLEQKLETYKFLLIKWQKAVNLVSPSTLPKAEERHFQDSLQLVPLLGDSAKTLVDMGSGAGFPGMLIAMARPDIEVHLVESEVKKCSFLRTVSRETNSPVIIHNCRIENLQKIKTDVLTARALAPLDKSLELGEPFFAANPQCRALFMKGRNAQAEIMQAKEKWAFEHNTHQSKTEEESCIVEINKLSRM
jgi:16S rRNA (guanine527-N7)-methyltransferase